MKKRRLDVVQASSHVDPVQASRPLDREVGVDGWDVGHEKEKRHLISKRTENLCQAVFESQLSDVEMLSLHRS